MSGLLEAIRLLGAKVSLTADQSYDAVSVIMEGEASEALIASFLTALRLKGETADELAGAVRAARDRAALLDFDPDPVLLDTCGTGGDGAHTINVSTATALVVAACGVPVAKHGNRAASGNSGSAEVLAELGITIEAEPEILGRCLRDLGITFLFAPRFHPALRFAAPVRKQLPFRTLFNLVGPLANPARPTHQLVGAPSEASAELIAQALARLGTKRSAVVTGSDGLDEVTLAGATLVRWVENGQVAVEEWLPEDFGLPRFGADRIRIGTPAESASRLRSVFAGEASPGRDLVLANSAAALRVAGRVSTLKEGVEVAADAIDSGSVERLLGRWSRWFGPQSP